MSDAAPAPRAEPLVGRGSEIAHLERALERARSGRGTVVFVQGEAGVGKTRLVAAFLARARTDGGLTVIRGRCLEHFGEGEVYLPFLDALGGLLSGRGRDATLEVMRTWAPTWCLQAASATVSPELREELERRTVGATRERMLRELADGVVASAGQHPLVLVLEDMQWADVASVDALRHLAVSIDRHPVLLLVTYRGDEIAAGRHALARCRLDLRSLPHVQEVALAPLAADAVAALVRARYGDALPAELTEVVHERTEGHPLFVVLFLEFLECEGYLQRAGSPEGPWTVARDLRTARLDVPESLRAMVRRRLERLPEEDQKLLQYASVVGREFLSGIVARLVERDALDVEERLASLARTHGLVELVGDEELPDGSFGLRARFVHALVHAVLYEDLVSRRRAALHLATAAELQVRYAGATERIAAPLARHLEGGRDYLGAVQQHVQAGDNAAALFAHAEALEQYGRAVRLLDRLEPGERTAWAARLQVRRGTAQHALGRFDEAIAQWSRLRAEAREAGSAALEQAALSGLCHALFFARRIDEMAVRTHEALETAAASGNEAARRGALVNVAQILLAEGRLGETVEVLEPLLPEAERAGDRAVLAWARLLRGFVRYWRARYGEAEADFTEGQQLGVDLRDGFLVLVCLMFRGLCRGYLGKVGDALSLFEEGAEMGRRNGDRFWLPRIVSHQGWIHRELQCFDEAMGFDREALALARERREGWAPEAEALLNLSVDSVRGGDDAQAVRHLDELATLSSGDWFAWLGDIRLGVVRAEEALLRGQAEAAAAQAEHVRQAAAERGADAYVTSAHALLAQAALARGDAGSAERHLAIAESLLRARPSAFDFWKVQAAIGRLNARRGARRPARDAYRRAESAVLALAESVSSPSLRAKFLASAAVREVREGAAEAHP